MALIAAVSDLSIFFDMVKGITIANDKINSRSKGEKSPSGPMRIVKFLLSLKSEIFNLSFEFKSANNSLVELSKLSKKSFNNFRDFRRRKLVGLLSSLNNYFLSSLLI